MIILNWDHVARQQSMAKSNHSQFLPNAKTFIFVFKFGNWSSHYFKSMIRCGFRIDVSRIHWEWSYESIEVTQWSTKVLTIMKYYASICSSWHLFAPEDRPKVETSDADTNYARISFLVWKSVQGNLLIHCFDYEIGSK